MQLYRTKSNTRKYHLRLSLTLSLPLVWLRGSHLTANKSGPQTIQNNIDSAKLVT